MGWCSATEHFDSVASQVIDNPNVPLAEQIRIVTALYKTLRDGDWDCEGDSEYYNHPVFITAEYSVENVDASDKVLKEFLPAKQEDGYSEDGEE
jgi:hypothetical protein